VQLSVPAIQAYQNDAGADPDTEDRWSRWKPFRRARQEKVK
jgi:hypothetical protein